MACWPRGQPAQSPPPISLTAWARASAPSPPPFCFLFVKPPAESVLKSRNFLALIANRDTIKLSNQPEVLLSHPSRRNRALATVSARVGSRRGRRRLPRAASPAPCPSVPTEHLLELAVSSSTPWYFPFAKRCSESRSLSSPASCGRLKNALSAYLQDCH